MILVISRWRAVALTLAVVGPVAGAPAQAQTARGTASPVASSEVRALAHLEPESGAIVIGARPGMRVEQVRVAVGQDVKAGELLAYVWGGRAPRGVQRGAVSDLEGCSVRLCFWFRNQKQSLTL